MDVRQLRYFLEIVEKGSFTKAARHLGIAQPALGFQIRKLEGELRTQLLIRNSRGVEPTESGEFVVAKGKQILEDVASLKRSVAEMSGTRAGDLRIGLTPSISLHMIVPLTAAIRKAYPAINIGIVEEMSSVLTEWVQTDRLDLAIAYDVLPTSGLALRRLGSADMCLVEARGCGHASSGTADLSELAELPMILPPASTRLRRFLDDLIGQRGIRLNVAYEIQSVPTIFKMVESGLGATVAAATAADPDRHDPALVSRPFVNPGFASDLHLAYRESRALGYIEPLIVKTVQDVFKAPSPLSTTARAQHPGLQPAIHG